jgi:hypothetical protein
MSLDFVVFGVPRSGTDALTRALNLHPQIMCAIEYFPDAIAASTATVPEAFEDERYSYSPNCEKSRLIYASKKGTATVFGNKDPRFSLFAEAFHASNPDCKMICIYRPKLGFWQSWDARANDQDDEHWERGQTGFFGLLELMCLLNNLSDVHGCGEVLLVNYDGLFFDDATALETAFNYLGVEPSEGALDAFRTTEFASAGHPRTSLSKERSALYRYLQLEDLERRIFVKPAITNREVASELFEYCRFARRLTSTLIDSHFWDMPLRELTYFLGQRDLVDALARQGVSSRVQRLLSSEETLVADARNILNELQLRSRNV